MKYYLIAGEASGDLHGSNLIKQILKSDKNSDIRCWGGDKMQDAGARLIKHYKDLAFMGFVEVIKNLPTILKNIRFCKKDIISFHPDVLILIDYPGFNMRIAKWAKHQRIKVVYYITPQVWAWHKSRVHDLGRFSDLLMVILPFEKAFFKKYGYDSIYVGHPLLDAVQDFQADTDTLDVLRTTDDILALLPGSRKQEIKTILPVMLEACKDLQFQIVIAAAPAMEESIYEDIIRHVKMNTKPKIITNQAYTILSVARYAFVSSGTATLETALFEVPQIVCYKGSAISYQIAKMLIDLRYISLVNLIAEKEVVRELIQHDLTPDNLRSELRQLMIDEKQVKQEYKDIKVKLGDTGASERAAKAIIELATG